MKLIVLILAAGIASAQTTRYPGTLDSDSSLFVVSDNVQSTLNAAMSTSDTAAVVASAAGFVPNMIATICDTSTNTGKCTAWEHMLVTAVAGNILTVTRGFAGTSPRTHSSGKLISVLIDAAHQKVLKDSVVAIETALGPNLSNIAASSGLITAGAFAFPAYSCNGSSVCAPGGPSGMSLIAGNNTLMMTPVPPGVNGSDTGHSLYVSGGAGTAEPCLITGGSGTAGQASGQIIVNCPNTHTGSWTISTASGGIQEAVCSLPSIGGEVAAAASVTLRANVTTCGKTGVTVTKQSGAVITAGSFNILNYAPYMTPGPEKYTNGIVTTQAKGTCPVNWDAMDAGTVMGRCTSDAIGPSATRSVLGVQQDFHGTTGVPWTIYASLNMDANTSNSGVGAFVGYTWKRGTATGVGFGTHGTCNQYAGGVCAGVNGEADQYAASAGTIIGLNANVGTISVGTLHTVWGLNASVSYPAGGVNPGGAGYFRAGSGEHTFGVRIEEGQTGKLDHMLELNSGQSIDNTVQIWNANSSPNAGFTGQIQFSRGSVGPKIQSAIVSDTTSPGTFINGYLRIQTRVSDAMQNTVTVSSLGLQILPLTVVALPTCNPAAEGSLRPVTDSTSNTWGANISGGGGSNHVIAYCNGTSWTVR